MIFKNARVVHDKEGLSVYSKLKGNKERNVIFGVFGWLRS